MARSPSRPNTRSAAPGTPSAGSPAPVIRCACPSSTSPRSVVAAAASPGSIPAARSESGQRAPAPSRVPLLTGSAATRPRSATPMSCSATSIAKPCWAGRWPSISRERRRRSASGVADPLGLGVTEAAAAIVEIVNSNMAEALRIVSVERGHDPREFALIAFGGAGPVHAAALAAELQIPEVIVPPAAGAFSALGLVASDLKRDYSRTLYADLRTLDPALAAAALGEMEATASEWLRAAAIPRARRVLLHAADLRYRRQAYELMVPFADRPVTRASLDRLAAAFHDKHRQTYGHANPEEPVQLVNLRLTAIGRLPGLTLAQPPATVPARCRMREVWFPGIGSVDCPVHWRDGLAAGETLEGPAIIEAMDSTIVVPPGWIATVDGTGYIRLRWR